MPNRPPMFRPFGTTPKHAQQQYDRQRGSATARGYDSKWRRYRERFLSLAENALCACGCGEPSVVVDHIIAVHGPNDVLFWSEDNHQGLTIECHNKKTATNNVWMGLAPEFEQRRAARRGRLHQTGGQSDCGDGGLQETAFPTQTNSGREIRCQGQT